MFVNIIPIQFPQIVRPPLEYAAPVWQVIPDFLSYMIESIQKRAMRIIFPLKGPSQPHLYFSLHARVWLLYFIRRKSKRRLNHCETTKDN